MDVDAPAVLVRAAAEVAVGRRRARGTAAASDQGGHMAAAPLARAWIAVGERITGVGRRKKTLCCTAASPTNVEACMASRVAEDMVASYPTIYKSF